MKIKIKLMIFISAIVGISIFPLSFIVLWRNEKVITDKTFEVCRNLSENIANFATEELLINETYDATRTAINRLKNSSITGLLDAYVINVAGQHIVDMNKNKLNLKVSDANLTYYKKIEKIDLRELTVSGKKILSFAYPIFIEYGGKRMQLGVAIFDFDKKTVFESIDEIQYTIYTVAGVILAFSLLIAFLSATYSTRPILALAEGARIIGTGDLGHRIKISSSDEIGTLASSFNKMAGQIHDFTQNLERKVSDRTKKLNEKTIQLTKSNKELKETQNNLIESEKKSSIINLAAGIAHELNNPLNYISGGVANLEDLLTDIQTVINGIFNGSHLNKKEKQARDFFSAEFDKTNSILKDIVSGVEKTAVVIDEFRGITGADGVVLEQIQLEELIRAEIFIIENVLKKEKPDKKINVVAKFPTESMATVNTVVISKALRNVIHNAFIYSLNAENSQIKIEVKYKTKAKQIFIVNISNNGGAIPADIELKIFDPFFTTKAIGEGTGLGLYMARNLLENQNARIILADNGRKSGWVTFNIELPTGIKIKKKSNSKKRKKSE